MISSQRTMQFAGACLAFTLIAVEAQPVEAVLPAANAVKVLMDCGPEWCDDMCPSEPLPGGWLYGQQCSSCGGPGCYLLGSVCDYLCVACRGATEYTCGPLGGG